jgi:hypothetical protein
VDRLPEWGLVILVGALSLTVLLGLHHRLLYQQFETRSRMHLFGLKSQLTFLPDNLKWPVALDDEWTVEQIADRLQRDLELDYGFLVSMGSDLDFARHCYKACYDRWDANETEDRGKLIELLVAYAEPTGSTPVIAAALEPGNRTDFVAIRAATDRLSRLARYSQHVSAACSTTFGLAVAILLAALVLQLLLPAS